MKLMRRMGSMGWMMVAGCWLCSMVRVYGQVATPFYLSVKGYTGSPVNRVVTITSLDGPMGFDGNNLAYDGPWTMQPVNGAVKTNLVMGNYRITFAGMPHALDIFWPADPAITNAADPRVRAPAIVRVYTLTNAAGVISNASFATNAGSATFATNSQYAALADNASHAVVADSATVAGTVLLAEAAGRLRTITDMDVVVLDNTNSPNSVSIKSGWRLSGNGGGLTNIPGSAVVGGVGAGGMNSPIVAYASSNIVSDVSLADLTSLAPPASVGTDRSALFQSLLDKATANGALHLIIDGRYVAGNLRVHSNTWIQALPGCGLIMPAGTDAPMFRNFLMRSNSQSPAILDGNITISGGIFNFNGRRQARMVTRVATVTDTNWGGGYVPGMLFSGVDGLTIRDTILLNPPTFSVHYMNTYRGLFENILFDMQRSGAGNVSCFQGDGPLGSITFRNMDFRNSMDDTIALNTSEGVLDPSTNGNYTPYFTGGTITNCHAYNITYLECFSAFRLLSTGFLIDNISFEGLYGSVSQRLGTIDSFDNPTYIWPYPSGKGVIGSVVFRDMNLVVTGSGEYLQGLINVNNQYITNFVMDGFVRSKTIGNDGYGIITTLLFDNGAVLGSLDIKGWKVRSPSGLGNGQVTINQPVNTLRILDNSFHSASDTTPIVLSSSAVVTNLIVRGNTTIGYTNLIKADSLARVLNTEYTVTATNQPIIGGMLSYDGTSGYWTGSGGGYDIDAADYFNAVIQVGGDNLNDTAKHAINTFVAQCKADRNWDKLIDVGVFGVTSNLSGALVKLKTGTAGRLLVNSGVVAGNYTNAGTSIGIMGWHPNYLDTGLAVTNATTLRETNIAFGVYVTKAVTTNTATSVVIGASYGATGDTDRLGIVSYNSGDPTHTPSMLLGQAFPQVNQWTNAGFWSQKSGPATTCYAYFNGAQVQTSAWATAPGRSGYKNAGTYYVLKGNGYGSPCVVSFYFVGQWYGLDIQKLSDAVNTLMAAFGSNKY